MLDWLIFLAIQFSLLSIVTFLVYAFDKFQARRGGWRVSESLLHILALLCGWPGAMLAQHWLRHKTVKQPFRQFFWLTVLLNLALVGTVAYLVWTSSR